MNDELLVEKNKDTISKIVNYIESVTICKLEKIHKVDTKEFEFYQVEFFEDELLSELIYSIVSEDNLIDFQISATINYETESFYSCSIEVLPTFNKEVRFDQEYTDDVEISKLPLQKEG